MTKGVKENDDEVEADEGPAARGGAGMILGFTGTSRDGGMTPSQLKTVKQLFEHLMLSVLHHGVCIGADAQAHAIALEMDAYIVGHPPTDERKMATMPDFDELREPLPYLKRNRNIIAASRDGLVAAPRQMIEPKSKRAEGTWTTIGYARQARRTIWIVRPDGTVEVEG